MLILRDLGKKSFMYSRFLALIQCVELFDDLRVFELDDFA